MNTQEKAQWLSDFYQQVGDGGEVQQEFCGGWKSTVNQYPTMESTPKRWRIKPKLKPVDLSVLVESGIDCEVGDFYNGRDGKMVNNRIAKLSRVLGKEPKHYQMEGIIGGDFQVCKPRMTPHIHAWMGGECPLPEGFEIGAYFRDGSYEELTNYCDCTTWTWKRVDATYDIIAFEVLGLADGYCWPWESE